MDTDSLGLGTLVSSYEGRGLRVRILSTSGVVAAALALLLEGMGFRSTTSPTGTAEVLLIDIRGMPRPTGGDASIPSVVVLGEQDDPFLVLRSGHRGYVRADDDPATMAKALIAVSEGEVWGERRVLQRLLLEPEPSLPTHRESEVLQLLVRGSSNRDIASRLGISVSTVKAHVGSLFEKFGVDTRLELVTQYLSGVREGP